MLDFRNHRIEVFLVYLTLFKADINSHRLQLWQLFELNVLKLANHFMCRIFFNRNFIFNRIYGNELLPYLLIKRRLLVPLLQAY